MAWLGTLSDRLEKGVEIMSFSVNDSSTYQAHSTIAGRLRSIGRALFMGGVFIRFTYLGFTTVMVLLGAASATLPHGNIPVPALLAVATGFHAFAYVMNDVIDLPLDRETPSRAMFPLVRGTVQPSQALTFALAMIPLTVGITALQGGTYRSYVALAVAFAMLAVYNLWGKRNPFPPLTDLAQGLGWGALAYYGATLAAGQPSGLTAVVVAFTVLATVTINGVHGDLRDLDNDLRCGMNTTAILLGARPLESGGVVLTRRFVLYAAALQAALIAVALLPLLLNWFGYGPVQWGVATGGTVALNLAACLLLAVAYKHVRERRVMIAAGMLNIPTWFGSPIVAFSLYAGPGVLALLVVVYLGPLVASSLFIDSLRWVGKQPAKAPQESA